MRSERDRGGAIWSEALGHLAIDNGKTVAWHTLETLAQLLRRHRADDSINKAIARLIRSDLVVIDLCRYRDYADAVAAAGLERRVLAGFPGDGARRLVGIVSEASRNARVVSAGL